MRLRKGNGDPLSCVLHHQPGQGDGSAMAVEPDFTEERALPPGAASVFLGEWF